jgi:PAS domain S-box-containing protein
MVHLLIILALSIALIAVVTGWRRDRKLLSESRKVSQDRDAVGTAALEKANEDLKASQADLQRRWQYLAEAQRLSHSGTFGWKVRSGELVWSDETYKILGFARETNPSLDLVFDRIHPEDVDRVRQLSDRAAQNAMDLDVEHRILLPDGVIKYVHAVAHAGRDSSGNLEYMGVVTDITDRKRAEEEREALSRSLQESKARLEEAQSVAHVGYWDWDLETGEIIWSDETYRIFGFKPQERRMDFETVRGLIHPDDREALYSTVDEEVAVGVHPVHQHRIVRPSGEVRTVQSITSKLWKTTDVGPEDGISREHNRLFGTVQDITELKQAEEASHALSRDLQESKDWLEEAQRVAHLGYWVWDLETNQVIWSEETYRIFGLVPKGDSFDVALVREMMHPDDREAVFMTAKKAIDTATRADCEHRLFRPDGEMRVVHSLGDVRKNSKGRIQMFGTTQDITDRKRVEEDRQALSNALQQSNARLEQAQRLAHIGHYEWDLIENRVTYSEELCRIWGIPPVKDSFDVSAIFERIHPEDREKVSREAAEAISNGIHAKSEHRIVLPSGEVRVILGLGTVKRDASGKAYEMFGTGQDITERKLAEQALRQSQFYLSEGERLAHIGSWASTDLGIRWSEDLNIYWSDEVYKIFGFDPKNGTPSLQQFLSAVHPQDQASLTATMKKLHEEHCGCDVTNRIVRPDGEIRYVRCVGIPVVEDGVFKGYRGTTMDVTEQELLTQELRREKAYLAEAQSLTHIGSWATNFHTKQMFHLSDEVYRLHGFDPNQGPSVLDRFWSTVHPDDEPVVRAIIENAIQTRTDYDIPEFRVCHPDGTIRFLRTKGHHTPSEEMGYYVGITMDITDRKHAEQEREKLRQLEADLAHINRVNMLGELAAALAHEIKQPISASITSANACLRWLAHDPPDLERARAAATRVEQEGNRAADVINNLRSFYKKGTPAERRMVEVKGIIREITVLLGDEALRHSVTIRSELDEHGPDILADRVQLQQVFMNLMLNAIEAMMETGGELTIRSGLNPEGQLLTSISDTGVGLPAENSERIFDAFHTTKPQGTGMGLAVTRSIVESHGGRIWATRNQGAGATFHFTLPVEAEARA